MLGICNLTYGCENFNPRVNGERDILNIKKPDFMSAIIFISDFSDGSWTRVLELQNWWWESSRTRYLEFDPEIREVTRRVLVKVYGGFILVIA